MAQLSTVSGQIEIKSHSELLYGFLKEKIPQLPQIYPEAIKGFQFLEGNEIRDVVVVYFEYVLDGCTMTLKEKLEVNDASKSIDFTVTEGDVLKPYNSMKYKFQVNSGHVKATAEFEKAGENSPDANGYIDMMLEIIKRLDACLCST